MGEMKSKFENHIKTRLESRSIIPSDKAWDKLEGMLDENQPERNKQSRFRRIFAAAAIALFLTSVFLINFLSNKPENASPAVIISQTEIPEFQKENSDIDSPKIVETKENSNEIIPVKKEPEIQIVQAKKKTPGLEISVPPAEIIQEKELEILPEKQEIKEPETVIALKADSVVKPAKKKNYTDPAMLLYSIENNDVIHEKVYSDPKLVIIDFNK